MLLFEFGLTLPDDDDGGGSDGQSDVDGNDTAGEAGCCCWLPCRWCCLWCGSSALRSYCEGWQSSAVMLAAFVGFGALPLLSFIPAGGAAKGARFGASCALAGAALAALGAAKAWALGVPGGISALARSAATMLALGGGTAGVAFLLGWALGVAFGL